MGDSGQGVSAAASVAIVGLAGHFPAARSVNELWRLLVDGREATLWLTDEELLAAGENPEALRDPNYVRAAMPLPDMDSFDAGFFGFTAREAAILDPQHRHFLEACWEALEDSGHPPARFKGSIGVFAGCGMQAYMARNLLTNPELTEKVGFFLLRHTGNDKDFLTTRVSYLLNLQGPSVGIQTACSTSLVAVHVACQSLLAGECDMALAGGVSIEVPHMRGYRFAEGEILSSTGKCRAFDDSADGVVFGSGAGVVVLRRLEEALADGDHIYAVIRGSAVNNDGASKAGYFAPSVEGQARAAVEALAVAGVDPQSVDYIEAHGTGTLVGDPIELAALSEAYPGTAQQIGIGSIKSNIGHLDTAAGVASLIKVALALKNEHVPASLNFDKPNSRFDFATGPFRVAARAADWRRGSRKRRAAINSLGVGGTNAHVVVEEAPAALPVGPEEERTQLVLFSGKTDSSLRSLQRKWVDFLAEPPADFALSRAAFTTQEGREHFSHRLAIAAESTEGLLATLQQGRAPGCAFGKAVEKPHIVFMFPGGGAQFPGAGRALYERQPSFRAAADACFEKIPKSVSAELRSLMFEKSSEDEAAVAALEKPLNSVLAVFVLEYAMAMMWAAWGVRPDAMIGHSAGEYAAAVIAGVMSLEDALEIVALRGDVFAQAPPGGMLSVKAGVDKVRALAADTLDIAAVNGSQLTVVSGSDDALSVFAQHCTAHGIETSRVRIQVAAHSRMLDSALPRFRERVRKLKLSEPAIPIVSSRTGGWAGDGLLSSSEYWVNQLRETVHFAQGLSSVLALTDPILLEVGPGQGLCALARLADGPREPNGVIATSRSVNDARNDEVAAFAAAGAVWAHGGTIDFEAMGARSKRRIPLPTYAFDKQRYWIEPASATAPTAARKPAPAIERLPRPEDWISVPKWVARPVTEVAASKDSSWLIFSDGGPVSQQLIKQLRTSGTEPAIVEPGSGFAEVGLCHYKVAPQSKADFDALLTALERRGPLPTYIAHLWSLDAPAPQPGAGVEQPLGFDSLFLLCQAMQLHGWEGVPRHLYGITTKALAVNDDVPSHPERAALVGPCRVVPHEMPGLVGHVIDIDPHASPEKAAADIRAEAAAGLRDELVAFRGGQRLVVTEEPVRSPPTARRLRDRGVYLVTGGLGGIGLELCAYLARNNRARLALLSRRELPPRASWEQLATRRDTPFAAIVRRLLEIEALGAEILILQADVTVRADAARAVKEARARFGEIHGVFHLAGVIDDAPVANKSLASAHQVIAPKLAGAIVLDELLPPGSLDLFAVFSSTSVIMGPPGQIDYVAANAVLESLAARREDGLALTSGIWNVGMAARVDVKSALPDAHPLLGECLSRSPEWRFVSKLRPSTTWALRDHMVGASAILPGAAYVDIIIEACAAAGLDGKTRVESINFIDALVCAGDTQRDVRTTISPAGEAFRVEIESRRSDGEAWTLHCEARLSAETKRQMQPLTRPKVDFAPLVKERLTLDDRGVRFGPRWRNLRACRVYGRFVECELQLPSSFAKELATHRAHPALLDVAATLGIFLLPTPEGQRGAWAPMSIEALTFVSRLPQRFHAIAHLRERETPQQATFDVDLRDPSGRSLILVRGITMRWLDESAFHRTTGSSPQISPDATVFDQMLAAGFHAEDAPSAFDAALATNGRHVVLSSIPLSKLRSLHTIKAAPDAAARAAASTVTYADKIEAAIADMCIDILGVDTIRPEDEFLSFGAGSLAGVRLFGRVRKELGVELSLSALFKAPRLRDLADLVRSHLEPEASQSATASVAPVTSGWSPLIKIATGGRHRRPVFCMPGAGGNIVTFKPLADRLAQDLPLYGLEARGVDGRAAFHETIEEIAECNLEAILSVAPDGPYRLAGYSGGGIVAFETAQRLQRMGRVVELLAMFDTLAPTEIHQPLTIAHNLKFFGQTSAPFLFNWLRQRLAGLVRGRQAAPESDLELAGSRAFQSFLAAQSRYEARPYRGDVLVFRAKHATRLYARAGDGLGWDKLVQGRTEAVAVNAWHLTMFEPPAIDVLAAVLDAKLDVLDAPRLGNDSQVQNNFTSVVAK